MWSLANFFLSLFLFSSFSSRLSYCRSQRQSQEIDRTIVVDLDGRGNFKSIQEAVDSVADFNDHWIKIHINAGVYREKVNIGGNKGFIILEGEGAQNTILEYGDYTSGKGILGNPWTETLVVEDTWNTATFSSQAHNVILSGITFKNTYASTTDVMIAVAAIIGGDNTSVYSCSFIGVQDTLADQSGKHYFKNCYVQGAIDFIFGFGQSIYEDCVLSMVSTSHGIGSVTAQGRNSIEDKSGFVFKSCKLTGTETNSYLGRGWRDFSRVLFYKTHMDNIVTPEGWLSWYARDGGKYTTFAEYSCSGPGSDPSGRVPWEKQLSESEVNQLVDISYINEGGWLDQQPDGFRY